MKHYDLGLLDGDVLLFGGAYSNQQAVHAVFAAARAAQVAPGHMICTGDVVAYCGAPEAVVRELRASGCAVIAGNCEVQLAQNADDCGCGFEEGTTCDRLSTAWYEFARKRLGSQARKWMAQLPDVITFTHHGKRYGVIHGGVQDIARFIWQTDHDSVFAEEWDSLEAAIGPVGGIVAGHSGLPFVRETPRGLWVNAGVIGMPPHDGKSATRFALLSQGQVEIRPLDYDAEGAASDMSAAGLPPEYHIALQSGYWPSEDVLPEDLRVAVSDRG